MRTLADPEALQQMTDRLASAIAAQMQAGGEGGWALVGLRSRGDLLAKRLAGKLDADRLNDRVGSLDITLYRDDLSEVGPQAVVRTTEVAFALDGLNVVLVDDVMMTGRSARAALDSLMDLGRPRRVWLAVLVDRGGRELPIAPDFVGLDLREASEPRVEPAEQVQVQLTPSDEQDAIIVQ
jgi:pyrimidine operon attenuation protein/uracil phosphoribosyltransferase